MDPSSSSPSPSSSPELPKETLPRRAKLAWRLLLISNLALGAYLFIKPIKKNTGEDQGKAAPEVPLTPTVTTTEVQEEPVFSPPPTPQPVKVREPIPEDKQRELFKWMLEEKRKIKPQSPEEKKRLDEEKAILKQFIRAKSVPKI